MKQSLVTRTCAVALAAIAMGSGSITLAQTPPAPAGKAAVVSEPGKATVARTIEASALVVGIDKATRTVTLKGHDGKVFDLVASDEVRNLDQIAVGDSVVVRYLAALTVELQKTRVAAGDVKVQQEAKRANLGEKPAVGGMRQVTVMADVVALDPVKSTISLKGPKGNVVTLDVQNPDQFKVVKKGDQVQVTYTEALALSVESAPKKQ
jgi:hypothetical protein